MRFAHSQTYLAAFAKPWYVTLGFLQAGARERGFRLIGFWPKGHPNAPKFPPGVGLGMKPAPVFLKEGDVVTLGIDGLGEQRQKVVKGKY